MNAPTDQTPSAEFDPRGYGPQVAALLTDARLPELGPGQPNRAAYEQLQKLTPESLSPRRPPADRTMAAACISGLWLLHDFLDESHRISQEIDTPTGSYWHGIMHRREPDYSNAKYWFRRVGEHPVFVPLAVEARQLAEAEAGRLDPAATFLAAPGAWSPPRFIDLCQAVAGSGSAAEELCRRVQLAEWRLLFDHCYRAVTK